MPTEAQLREWWEQEQRFMETRLGGQWYRMRHELERLERERDHYRKRILDQANVHIKPPILDFEGDVEDALPPRPSE